MTLYYRDDQVEVHSGDCRDVLATLPVNSVDSVVCDPPYDLLTGKSAGFMGSSWDATGVAFDPETWRAVMRVMKPGGFLVAFGGSRTWHRLACAIEDAGFEIRESVAWLHGEGMPKGIDVSKAIDKVAGVEREIIGTKHGLPGYSLTDGNGDHRTYGRGLGNTGTGEAECAITAPATDAAKQWQGWNTSLKPSFEPAVVARKPLASKTVVENVLEHGTGALNIDACRIEAHDSQLAEKYASVQNAGPRENTIYGKDDRDRAGAAPHPAGRWPTNVVLDESMAAELDKQSGNRPGFAAGDGTSGHGGARKKGTSTKRSGDQTEVAGAGYRTEYVGGESRETKLSATIYADQGGASRFFPVFKYSAKAGGAERPSVDGVQHFTVKPLELIRWLVKLVTPPAGTVLDCFAGSGTTGEAAIHEHMRAILIEKEPTYLPLIVARLSKPMEIGFDFG